MSWSVVQSRVECEDFQQEEVGLLCRWGVDGFRVADSLESMTGDSAISSFRRMPASALEAGC